MGPVEKLLSDKSKWTTGVYARNSRGSEIGVNETDAVCFCLSGAIRKCYGYSKWANVFLPKINQHLTDKLEGETGIYIFNDTHTYEEVMILLKELEL